MAITTEGAVETRSVTIPAGATLAGDLAVPHGAHGLVVFVHGSGSSRLSSRNRAVAHHLNGGHLATLLFDLLTPAEEEIDARTRHMRFDVELLAARLERVTDWLGTQPDLRGLDVGYFGASTGAAAALIAAARHPDAVHAVVSRGGRPDLAGAALAEVRAPTLLIVGSLDVPVIGMNQAALARLGAPTTHLEIVRGASHLFEERGTLERVAELALDWFARHLAGGRHAHTDGGQAFGGT